MHALYQNFRTELGKFRRMIENGELDGEQISEYLNSDEFYKQVITFRIDEYFHGKTPTKKELLKLLSLWEMEL